METWAIVYEKWLGNVAPTQEEAHARQNVYIAKAELQAALASLTRKLQAKAEAEVKPETRSTRKKRRDSTSSASPGEEPLGTSS